MRSIPAVVRERAESEPRAVAFREKRLGRYVERTWSDVAGAAADLAVGFVKLGMTRGDRVALLGDSSFDLAVAELAVWTAGGISVGIDPRAPTTQVGHQLAELEPTLVVVQNQEYLERLLEAAPAMPDAGRLVIVDEGGLFFYDRAFATRLADVRALGAEASTEERERVESGTALSSPDDPATIVFTSGVAGETKPVLHSHESLLLAARTLALLSPELARGTPRSVATLPLCELVGKLATILLPLVTRLVPHFPEAPDTWSETIFEVAPTYVNERPRFWKLLAARVIVGVEASSRLKRAAYRSAIRTADAVLRRSWEGKPVRLTLRVGNRLARTLVLVPLLRQLGLHRLKGPMVGWSPVAGEIVRDWQRRGLDLRIVYGLAEAGAVAAQAESFPNPVDVGFPVAAAGCEVRLDDQDVLLVRSPSLALGYWSAAGLISSPADSGYMSTGDRALLKDGRLQILGDEASLGTAPDGGRILLQRVESELKASPYVSEAAAYCDASGVAALVELDFETVSAWARTRRLVYSTYTDLVSNADVHGLADAAVAAANSRLGSSEQIREVRVLVRPFAEQGALTTTWRVRRDAVVSLLVSAAI